MGSRKVASIGSASQHTGSWLADFSCYCPTSSSNSLNMIAELLPKVWPVISAMVGNGKSVMVASSGKKPELLAAGLVSDSSNSRP